MSRVIIAFAGSKGSGKTTAFNTINEAFSDVSELTLAGHLKKVCSKVFKIPENEFHNQTLKEQFLEDPIYLDPEELKEVIQEFGYAVDYDNIRKHIGKVIDTRRQLLQYIGTDVLHPVDPLIHIKYTTKNMPKDGIVVVTDLRFENEFNFFVEKYSNEFIPFYIQNLNAELAAEGDTHPSETQLKLFKHKCKKIDNNSTIVEFRNKLIEEIWNLL